MSNLWKAIFLECIFRAQCDREGLPHNYRPFRTAWASAYVGGRFTFTVMS